MQPQQMKTFFRQVEDKLRHSYYPSWLIHQLANVLGIAKHVSRYPLADQADSLSCRPLFIISAGRSGTTLLRSMLVAGEEIAIPPESCVMPMAILRFPFLQIRGWEPAGHDFVRSLENHESFPIWEADLKATYHTISSLPQDERSLERIIDEVFKCYAAQKFPTATAWGDQSPLNTYYLPWLLHAFPKARYLHIVRDSRDAIASYIEKGESEGRCNRRQLLAKHTRSWIFAVRETSWLQRQLNSDDQYLEVQYETLVSDPVATLKQVCDFAGIQHCPEKMLSFHKSPTTVEHKYQQHHANLAKPLFTHSTGRWVERLLPAEQAYILAKTGKLLQQLGYLPEGTEDRDEERMSW